MKMNVLNCFLLFVTNYEFILQMLSVINIFITGINSERDCKIIPYRRYLLSSLTGDDEEMKVIFTCIPGFHLIGQSSAICEFDGIEEWDNASVPACGYEVAAFKEITTSTTNRSVRNYDAKFGEYVDTKLTTCNQWNKEQTIHIDFRSPHSFKKIEIYHNKIGSLEVFSADVTLGSSGKFYKFCGDFVWSRSNIKNGKEMQTISCPEGNYGDAIDFTTVNNVPLCELKVYAESENEFPTDTCHYVGSARIFTSYGKCMYALSDVLLSRNDALKACTEKKLSKLATATTLEMRRAFQTGVDAFGNDKNYWVSNESYIGDSFPCPLLTSSQMAITDDLCSKNQAVLCEKAPGFCPPPDVGQNQLITCAERSNVFAGESVNYKCVHGWRLEGKAKRYCTKDAIWEKRPICV